MITVKVMVADGVIDPIEHTGSYKALGVQSIKSLLERDVHLKT